MSTDLSPATSPFAAWVESCGSQQEAKRRLAAEGVDVSQQTISKWASGLIRPDPQHRAGIARASGVAAWLWLMPSETHGLTLPTASAAEAA